MYVFWRPYSSTIMSPLSPESFIMLHIPVQHTSAPAWISQSDQEYASELPPELRLYPWRSGYSLDQRLIRALRGRRYDTMNVRAVTHR